MSADDTTGDHALGKPSEFEGAVAHRLSEVLRIADELRTVWDKESALSKSMLEGSELHRQVPALQSTASELLGRLDALDVLVEEERQLGQDHSKHDSLQQDLAAQQVSQSISHKAVSLSITQPVIKSVGALKIAA